MKQVKHDYRKKHPTLRCPICHRRIKLNLADRKTSRPVFCYRCYMARHRTLQNMPPEDKQKIRLIKKAKQG